MAIEPRRLSSFPCSANPKETPRLQRCVASCSPQAEWFKHLGAFALLRPKRRHAQKKSAHATEQDRPDILKRRRAWFDSELDLDPEKLVFIDET